MYFPHPIEIAYQVDQEDAQKSQPLHNEKPLGFIVQDDWVSTQDNIDRHFGRPYPYPLHFIELSSSSFLKESTDTEINEFVGVYF